MTNQELADRLRAEAHAAGAFESTNHELNAAMLGLCALMREAADRLEHAIPLDATPSGPDVGFMGEM